MKMSLYSAEECEKISRMASLRYVHLAMPGITRKPEGKSFIYFSPENRQIVDEMEIARINAIKIPPAWKDVWICPYANGHIQATGRDDRNRKQYRYHPLWQETRKQQKFHMMRDFGRALPLIREYVRKVLNLPFTFEKEQVICAIIALLDSYPIRIGNKIYAKENQSYGITTLRKKHVVLKADRVILDFRGKNAKEWHVVLKDKKLVRILRRCMDIPGYQLFRYLDKDNQLTVITSQELNTCLQSLTGQPFTAKDFRTWFACRETLAGLIQKERTPADIIQEVAILMGHTPRICQKSYIDPEILSSNADNRLDHWLLKEHKNIENMDSDQLLLYWLETRDI